MNITSFLNMEPLQLVSFIFGLIASLCIGIYTIPQLILLLKTKDSSGISGPMFLILVAGDIFFVVQSCISLIDRLKNNDLIGWLTTLFPVLVANFVCIISGSITLTIKLLNQHRAKKANISEREYCELLVKNKIQKSKSKKK